MFPKKSVFLLKAAAPLSTQTKNKRKVVSMICERYFIFSEFSFLNFTCEYIICFVELKWKFSSRGFPFPSDFYRFFDRTSLLSVVVLLERESQIEVVKKLIGNYLLCRIKKMVCWTFRLWLQVPFKLMMWRRLKYIFKISHRMQ